MSVAGFRGIVNPVLLFLWLTLVYGIEYGAVGGKETT